MIAGIDFSSRAVDVVLLDEDTDRAVWHRFELEGADAFERARSVRNAMPKSFATFWDYTLAIGIEDPRGYNAGALYRVQGAILAALPPHRLVHPLIPSQWRKTVGLPGNAPKFDVREFALGRWEREWKPGDPERLPDIPPQDACDAYCIALATRTVLEHGVAA